MYVIKVHFKTLIHVDTVIMQYLQKVCLKILAVFLCYRLPDPCQGSGVPCEQTYSFRHTLNLTSDSALFAVSIIVRN